MLKSRSLGYAAADADAGTVDHSGSCLSVLGAHAAATQISQNGDYLQDKRIRSITELVESWFTLYHPWFPILHKPSFLSDLSGAEHDFDILDRNVVLKAIIAVTDQTHQGLPRNFYDEALLYSMKTAVSLSALQALLIISLADLNSGRLSDFWKVVALCKNIGTQLGLRDLVSHYCQNYNQASVLAPRMLPLPNTFIEREERIRAYWMVECLDASSTLGSAWNIGLLTSFPSEILPCSDEVWETANPELTILETDQGKLSSFAMYVSLVTKELNRVHTIMQEPYDFTALREHERWRSDCDGVYDELRVWREAYLPNLFAGSIVAMYQKGAIETAGQTKDRCIRACNRIASISSIVINQVQLVGSHNLLGFFVAARFLLVHTKTQGKSLQASFYSLLTSFKEASKYWKLAYVLYKVLSTAAQEHGEQSERTALPPQLLDLKYSALDIYHALQLWSVNDITV
ncbi:hypothetical protein BKA65DRAFT_549063 [Rhexocercosporidium sp. MPI-PUGE-AT-0058]|nr:hypothetical protein BKA65DRAFT_549063 [Rhexocercosporidium sp. MPI-PUGE-AT-0058]